MKSSEMGLRGVASLAPSTFLASAVYTCDLQKQILQYYAKMLTKALYFCQQVWCDISTKPIPNGSLATKQQSWNKPVMIREFSILLERHVDDYDKARLLTAASRHSADWLHAVPITSCGLHLDDDQVDVRDSHALSSKVAII